MVGGYCVNHPMGTTPSYPHQHPHTGGREAVPHARTAPTSRPKIWCTYGPRRRRGTPQELPQPSSLDTHATLTNNNNNTGSDRFPINGQTTLPGSSSRAQSTERGRLILGNLNNNCPQQNPAPNIPNTTPRNPFTGKSRSKTRCKFGPRARARPRDLLTTGELPFPWQGKTIPGDHSGKEVENNEIEELLREIDRGRCQPDPPCPVTPTTCRN